jgi:hypothetical protein
MVERNDTTGQRGGNLKLSRMPENLVDPQFRIETEAFFKDFV